MDDAMFWWGISILILIIVSMSILVGKVLSGKPRRPRDPEDVPMITHGDHPNH